MKLRFISHDSLKRFILEIEADSIYGLVESDTGTTFERLNEEKVERLSLRCVRPAASVKSFLMPVKERVAVYPGGDEAPWEHIEGLPRAVVGVRACGLNAVAYLDDVFLKGDFKDPFYEARREKTTLISVDCIAASEKCFCTLIGERPYPTSSFDLNLTPVENGYVAEAGSEKGEAIAAKHADCCEDLGPEHLKQRDAARDQMVAKLQEQNREFELDKPLDELVGKCMGQEKWIYVSIPCVECGACTNVCPTCYCFMLYDKLLAGDEKKSERVKIWDSCLLSDYHRMAGVGGSKPHPRPELRTRFESRFMHKFVHSYENLKKIACVACGRCIEACLGGIDIRAVLRELAK